MSKSKTDSIVPGGVDEYIAGCPPEVQPKLREIRQILQELVPDAVETVSYFNLPGYSYQGYAYNGMFAWFSYQKTSVRLHIIPPVLESHKSELKGYAASAAIVSFPLVGEIPRALVVKLVKASIEEMKGKK